MTDKPPLKREHAHAPEQTQKKWSFTPSAFVLIIGIALMIGYAGGTRNDQIVATVGPALGFKVASGTIDLSSVENTFRQLKSNFDGDLDEKALIQGASKGLVAASGDIHTEYFTEKEAKQFKDDLSGDIGGGIGAEIGMREKVPTVIRALKDTPAEKAGLQSGDQLLAINDEAIGEQTVDQVVQKIRGEIDSTVKITVLRNDEMKEFTITRAKITSPSVDSSVEGDVGTLKITRFDEQTGDAARAAAQEFKNKNVKKVILDLRDNGGGYLTAAPEVAGLWLDNNVVVSERVGGETKAE
ncbi:PDZ domain-containing protein, partial [Candidatus Saccharibacteria bacterium]|nr:PDZ domain-containing protein [Candidatus Saccharibacteria bacterium]